MGVGGREKGGVLLEADGRKKKRFQKEKTRTRTHARTHERTHAPTHTHARTHARTRTHAHTRARARAHTRPGERKIYFAIGILVPVKHILMLNDSQYRRTYICVRLIFVSVGHMFV